MKLDILIFVLCFLLVVGLTFVFKAYAHRKQLIDIPNERSSHVTPTPRGGGISIVLVFLCFISVLFFQERLSFDSFVSLLIGGSLVASVGFWDDHQHIPARYRLLFHLLAAGVALFLLSAFPVIPLVFFDLELGWLGYPVLTIALVWLLNLFNFMDGIDGIASVEAVSVAGGGALILLFQAQYEWAFLFMGLVVSVCGFLVWNWPPASIFMGDACSGFLGFVLGLLAITTSATTDMSIWSWVILCGVFVVDATVTLIRRMLRGEVWCEAHRSHGYQILSRRWESHRRVTLAVSAVNGIWLLPLAFVANYFPLYGVLLFFVAITPLMVLDYSIGAGVDNG